MEHARCLFFLDTSRLTWNMHRWKYIFMANETDTPSGEVSDEGKQPSVQSSGELSLGPDHPHALSVEGHAPPWLRMDPELSRAVLAKTEEELLGSLSALMRNKIEHEKLQRALAHTELEIEAGKQELAGVKRQVSVAEDELNTRLADHSRTVDEIAHTQSQLQADQRKYLQFQDDLIAAKNELEKVKSEVSATSAQLAELQLQHHTLLPEIEKSKNEMMIMREERRVTLEQIEPVRQELDERLAAREALIQEITVMERHLAELTSTRDIRANAQRVALVGRGTESMGQEIKQLKGEIERIEKERMRLSAERDRVEAEFGALQSRLNAARFSYAETLERLDEARAALAVTEHEHDETVSKLVQAHGQQAKLVAMPAELTEQKEQALAAEISVPPAVEPPTEKDREREELLAAQTNVDAEEELALPLLKNEPLAEALSSWDSYRLESEFFTEEKLDADRVAYLVSELPGIESTLVVRQRGAVLAGDLPQRLSDQLRIPDRDYELLFKNWPNRGNERRIESTQITTVQAGDEFLTATQAHDIFLIVSHERPKLYPGVEEKLAVVVEELAKMYPKAGYDARDTSVASR
jgi:hypothetical protein